MMRMAPCVVTMPEIGHCGIWQMSRRHRCKIQWKRAFQHSISCVRGIARSYDSTSYHLLKPFLWCLLFQHRRSWDTQIEDVSVLWIVCNMKECPVKAISWSDDQHKRGLTQREYPLAEYAVNPVTPLTVTPWCAQWHLKAPDSPLFTQPFIQAQTKNQSSASLLFKI